MAEYNIPIYFQCH